MAQMERFELSHRLSQSTPLAGEPLRPLGYFSMAGTEREGFEPPVPFDITGFQDQRLQPLGHLSIRLICGKLCAVLSAAIVNRSRCYEQPALLL